MAKSDKPEAFTKLKTPSIVKAVFSGVFIIIFAISMICVESNSFRIFALINIILNSMMVAFNTMKLLAIKQACEDFKLFVKEVLGGKKEH